MKQKSTRLSSGMIRGLFFALNIVFPIGCSMSFHDKLAVGPTYVTCTVSMRNGTFPPKKFLTRIDLNYDPEQLLYVKNRNDFALKYRDPAVVMTDRGLSIDFGPLPSEIFSSVNEITLYFLPLKKGNVTITGNIVRREKELILGPREPAVAERIPEETAHCSKSFNRGPGRAEDFASLARKHVIPVEPENLKGRGVNLFIPADRLTAAAAEIGKILKDEGFFFRYSVRFDSGASVIHTRVSDSGREIVEMRATIDERGAGGGYLYLYAFGNTPVDDVMEKVGESFRKRM